MQVSIHALPLGNQLHQAGERALLLHELERLFIVAAIVEQD